MSIKDTIEKSVEKYLEEDKMYRKKITPTGDLSYLLYSLIIQLKL